MDAGRLNKRIAIKQLTKTSDGFGGTTSTKSTLATIWGRVVEKKGDVEVDGYKRQRQLETTIIVRKKTADSYLSIDRILTIEGKSGEYLVTGIFENQIDDYTQVETVKLT
jgi:head-tail adaptor